MAVEGDPEATWYPIASSDDLPFRHTFHGQLLGRELAVWRADDGYVNVWQNRCLHRGLRLSIGSNVGDNLVCQYHGWRYESRSAACIYIPAHPADAPARTLCNTHYPSVERHGLVWSGLDPSGEPTEFAILAASGAMVLRSLPMNVPSAIVLESLLDEDSDLGGAAEQLDTHAVLRSEGGEAASPAVVFFVQPVDVGRSVVRPVMAMTPTKKQPLDLLRQQNAALVALRDELEHEVAP